MPGSIPSFATSDAPAVVRDDRTTRWSGLARAARTGAGAVGLALTLTLVAVALLADVISPTDPFATVGRPLSAPTRAHVFGTDDLGRDVLSGIVHGARTSLIVTAGVTLLAALIGVAVGTAAGYKPGAVDDLLMRGTDFVLVVPRFFMAVVVIALFGPGLDRLILVLGLTSWPAIARVVRAQTLSLAHQAFVDAAHALGASGVRIALRHVLPHTLPAALVIISINAAGVILLEAALGFLGLGDPRLISWGYLASNAQRFIRIAWWMALFPGLAIALAVLGLNLLGDAVNDLLEPRARGAAGA